MGGSSVFSISKVALRIYVSKWIVRPDLFLDLICVSLYMTVITKECHGVSDYRKFSKLYTILFKLSTKKTPKLRVTGLFKAESTNHLNKAPLMR